MDEAHYDTPWEFKNRGFAALRQRPHSTASPTAETVTSPTKFKNNHTLNSIERSENASVSPPRSISNHQIAQVLHSPTLDQTPRQPLINVKRTHFPVTASTSSSVNSTPLVEHRRRRSEKVEDSRKTNQRKLELNYPHVRNHSYGVELEPIDKHRGMSQNKGRYKYDDSQLVHDTSLSRVEAEKLLSHHQIGVFLVRLREEGNLALSLKASDGVLHIKLEEREGRWVLGEGPSFSSISSCIRYYRKTELPIRGAEHILLRYPIMTPVKLN